MRTLGITPLGSPFSDSKKQPLSDQVHFIVSVLMLALASHSLTPGPHQSFNDWHTALGNRLLMVELP